MYKKITLRSFGVVATLAIAVIVYLLFVVKIGPVNTSKVNSIAVTGIVDSLYEGGVKDLVVKLENNSNNYYINRALENGFNLESINASLLVKKITLLYAKSRNRCGGHIMQLKFQDSIYYTEWQNPLASKN